jgi:hypothetical protein
MNTLEIDILRKFGIRLPKNQVSEVIAMLNSDP